MSREWRIKSALIVILLALIILGGRPSLSTSPLSHTGRRRSRRDQGHQAQRICAQPERDDGRRRRLRSGRQGTRRQSPDHGQHPCQRAGRPAGDHHHDRKRRRRKRNALHHSRIQHQRRPQHQTRRRLSAVFRHPHRMGRQAVPDGKPRRIAARPMARPGRLYPLSR